MSLITHTPFRGPIELRYFEDVLEVEFEAINKRRKESRARVRPLQPKESPAEYRGPEPKPSRTRSPDPDKLFRGPSGGGPSLVDPRKPDYHKTRPRPVPCDAVGLAFSGGGTAPQRFASGPCRRFIATAGSIPSTIYLACRAVVILLLSLCRRLRVAGTMPIIMVAAMGTETDRVVGLEIN
jgi:hypothetical protein